MRNAQVVALIALLALCFASCSAKEDGSKTETTADSTTSVSETSEITENKEMTELKLKIGDTEIETEWEDNESVSALRELASDGGMSINMSGYGGFEQVGEIGSSLPSNDKQTTTEAGDIVLYSGDKIVIFYGSNSWSYTRLGKIKGLKQAELEALLKNKDVTLTLFVSK